MIVNKPFSFILLTCLILQYSCSVGMHNAHHSGKRKTITSAVFHVNYACSSEGLKNESKFKSSLIDSIKQTDQIDKDLEFAVQQQLMMLYFDNQPAHEIHLDIRQDTIWRYETAPGKSKKKDLTRIGRTNGVLYFDSRPKNSVNREMPLFQNEGRYTVTEFPDDQKKIKGYSCFKVIVTESDREGSVPGKTITEMYVTRNIDLPVHAAIYIGKYLPDYFPLSIKQSSEKMKGCDEVWEIMEIR